MTPTEFINRLFIALTDIHPIHSMTVHFPIALTAVALLFLVLALWRRNEGLERAAFYNLTLAAVFAIIASFLFWGAIILDLSKMTNTIGAKAAIRISAPNM